MVEIDQSVRARAFVDKWFSIAVVALLLLSAVTGWWAYQVNAVPDTETEERLVEQWSETTGYNHSAEIVNESIPFDVGQRVTNRPIYYFNLSKELDGEYRYSYSADAGSVSVVTETFLLVRAGELTDQRVNRTYWRVSRPLNSVETADLSPGAEHVASFTVDIRYVLETINTVQQQVGATEGLVDVRVRSITQIEGQVEGSAVDRTYESDLAMVVNPATFRVATQSVVDERHQSFESATVVVPPGPLEQYGSIGLFALGVALLLGLVAARFGGYTELSEDEREVLEIERHREQYSEWITTGTFPSERDYDQTILVDDLEGLIDIAIDTNKRVIEDPQLGVSTVLDDDYIYLYVRPDSPASDWLVQYADTTLDNFDRNEF
jgi:hypothetical protein